MKQHEGGPSKSTLAVAVWAVCTAVWSIFTPPFNTWPARILIFQPLWILRVYRQETSCAQDAWLALVSHAIYSRYKVGWQLPALESLWSIDTQSDGFRIYVGVFGLLATCGALAGGIVRRESQLKSDVRSDDSFDRRIDEQLLPPLLLPSRTTHSRIFPKKHSFSYSYLFVGIPVGVSGRLSAALSVDCDTHSWFHVDSDDYLARDRSGQTLGHKLKSYLHTRGVTDRDYAFAYLVTAPKFLGYSFNPASFWYIYDSDALLKYMIVEVNNTFDERRMYLLKAGKDSGGEDDGEANGNLAAGKATMFTDNWQKDFHVSPFNSTKGSYSLKAVDPLSAWQESGSVKIDNTIVLRSSKTHPKIVARVWSDAAIQDANSISPVALLQFIAAWCWVGFATFPRILWEANKLFFRQRLHVWFRPEVAETSLGRPYTAYETTIERFFAAFIEDVVSNAEKPLRVIYEAAHADGHEVVIYSPGFTYQEAQQRTLTIKVLSPAFYSRLVHYAHIQEVFDRECLATEDKNRTVIIQEPQLLPAFLEATRSRRATLPGKSRVSMEELRWHVLQRLRCAPPAQSYGQTRESSDHVISDIRSFCDSELDRFVRYQKDHVGLYQRITLKLFLAQRFAFGAPFLISIADWLFRASILGLAMVYSSHATAFDIFRPELSRNGDLGSMLLSLLLANGVHLWSFAKG